MSTANKMVNEEEVAAKSSEVLIWSLSSFGNKKIGGHPHWVVTNYEHVNDDDAEASNSKKEIFTNYKQNLMEEEENNK